MLKFDSKIFDHERMVIPSDMCYLITLGHKAYWELWSKLKPSKD